MSDHPLILILTAFAFFAFAVFIVVTGEAYVGGRVGLHLVGTQRITPPFAFIVAASVFMLGLAAAFEAFGRIFPPVKAGRRDRVVLMLSWGGFGLLLLGAIMQVLANA